MGAGEATQGGGRRPERVLPVRRSLLLGEVGGQQQQRRVLPVQQVSVRAPVAQRGGGGVGAAGAVAQAGVLLLLEALCRAAAEGVAGHAAPLATPGGAVGVGGGVHVGVAEGRGAPGVVQRQGVVQRLPGGGVGAQRGLAAQGGVFWPRWADGATK